jgi:hypothetical protein
MQPVTGLRTACRQARPPALQRDANFRYLSLEISSKLRSRNSYFFVSVMGTATSVLECSKRYPWQPEANCTTGSVPYGAFGSNPSITGVGVRLF